MFCCNICCAKSSPEKEGRGGVVGGRRGGGREEGMFGQYLEESTQKNFTNEGCVSVGVRL
jgi:hypothetical protein